MNDLPETILQFGSGKFLRGFVDYFVHQANASGQGVGRVVVVQSTGDRRADLLNQQRGRYHVAVRGLLDGKRIDRVEEVNSVSRALIAAKQWDEVLHVAASPQLKYIVCNTAEAGYALDPQDSKDSRPPHSFPARLLRVLEARFRARQPAPTLLPCELFEGNADLLRGLILKLAGDWQLDGEFCRWVENSCSWHNALVDRIVCNPDAVLPGTEGDALLTVTEPFAFWAVEDRAGKGGLFQHPAILRAPDVRPYFLRKVRILNAAHTAMASKAHPRGVRTVLDAMNDADIGRWVERLLFEEIVPTLEGRVDGPETFARQTLERFRNPFLEHKIQDILAYHAEKVKIRLVPTRAEFVAKFGRNPPLLDEALALAEAVTKAVS
jgi:tagaturonate reductase